MNTSGASCWRALATICGSSGPAPLWPTRTERSSSPAWLATESTNASQPRDVTAWDTPGTTTQWPRSSSSAATQRHVLGPTTGLCTSKNDAIGTACIKVRARRERRRGALATSLTVDELPEDICVAGGSGCLFEEV